MFAFHLRIALPLLAAAAIAPLASAQAAAPCPTQGAFALAMGIVASVPAGLTHNYKISLGSCEGVIVNLATLKPQAKPSDAVEESEDELDGKKAAASHSMPPAPCSPRNRAKCSRRAAASVAGALSGCDEAREILARRRYLGVAQSPTVSAGLNSF